MQFFRQITAMSIAIIAIGAADAHCTVMQVRSLTAIPRMPEQLFPFPDVIAGSFLVWTSVPNGAPLVFHDGTLTELNPFPGSVTTLQAINRSGHMVVTKTVDSAFYVGGLGTTEFIGLGGKVSWARNIDDNDRVVGSATLSDGTTLHAYLYDGRQSTIVDLGALAGGFSSATAINSKGHIVGDSTAADGTLHPFFYDGHQMHDLGLPIGQNQCTSTSLNNNGYVWGQCGGRTLGFVHDGITMRTFDRHLIVDVNESGVVIGDVDGVGFRIDDAGEILLRLNNVRGSSVRDVNDRGDVVAIAGNVPFIFDAETRQIDELIVPGWTVFDVIGFQDGSNVLAYAVQGGKPYLVALSPVPEPSSLLLLALGSFTFAASFLRAKRS
jgi:probable HAF family extracellular repeat protein